MNMQSLMAQAQKMQRDITRKKEEIDATEFVGKSEWVEVVFNGKRELIKTKIIYAGTIEEDEKEILEDMFALAVKDAMSKINKEIDSKLGAYSQSFNGLI